MNKLEIAVALGLYGAAINSGVGPSAYAEGSRCEADSPMLSCPVPLPELAHVHVDADTDGGTVRSGAAAILKGADRGALSGTVSIKFGATASLTTVPAAQAIPAQSPVV